MDDNTKEIDLLKVALYIFHRKLVIIISFILALCLGYFYINSLTKEKLVYLDLDILKSNELYEYSLINFLSTKYNTTDKEPLGIDFMPINSKNFGLLALTIFNDRSIKNDIIKSSNFLNISSNDDMLSKVSSNFILLEPILNKAEADLSGRSLTPYYQLRFKTNLEIDNQNYKNLFLHTLTEVESRVKERVNDMYQRNINILSMKNKFEKDNLINRKNNLIDDYIIERKARLLYLEENLAIAKAIEQDTDSNKRAPFLDNAKVNIYEGASDPFPYYFYGSTAIMQEIQEVKKDMNVIDSSVAIEGVLSIDNQIRKINENKTAEEINIALDDSPLGENNKFKVFSYNIDNLKYVNEGKSYYLIMFFFGLVGIFFGLILIFISYLRKEIKDLS